MGRRGSTSEAMVLPPLDSRARETDRRIWRIATMMTSGTWDRHGSQAELAAEWGLSESQLRNMSAEAGRILRMVKAPEAAIEHVLARLHELMSHPLEPLETIAAARAILDGYKAFGFKGGPPDAGMGPQATPAQQVDALVSELSAPGPELAEALERAGWRRVVETVGTEVGEKP